MVQDPYHKSRALGSVAERQDVQHSEETEFWASFKKPLVFQQKGPCVGVSILSDTGAVAVAASIRVTVRSGSGLDAQKTAIKIKDNVQSMAFRVDGRLAAVGTVEGDVLVVNPAEKSLLRTLRGHRAAVKAAAFLPNKTHLLTGSDDKTVALWDIAAGTEVWHAKVFYDFVRAVAVSGLPDGYIAAGSYDHSVKIWRMSSHEPTMCFDVGSPVESLVFFSGGQRIAVAASNTVSLWDISGDSPQCTQRIEVHHKTLSAIQITHDCRFLLTASLDQSVKVIFLESMSVVHQFKFSSAVMSMALSNDSDRIAVGLTNGQLVVISRIPVDNHQTSALESDVIGGRMVDDKDTSTFVVSSKLKGHMHRFDKLIRAFKYRAALDEVVRLNRPNMLTIAVAELLRRHALVTAISGRSEESLLPLLRLISKSLCRPEHTSMAVEAAFAAIDIYGPVAHEFPRLEKMLRFLDAQLRFEVSVQDQLMQLSGHIQTIFDTAVINTV